MPAAQEHPCMLFLAENAVKSATYIGGPVDVVELQDMGSCIDFVNVQTLSLKPTDCTCSTNITEVS